MGENALIAPLPNLRFPELRWYASSKPTVWNSRLRTPVVISAQVQTGVWFELRRCFISTVSAQR